MKKYFLLVSIIFTCCCCFAQNGSNALLWRISGKGLNEQSYLFGTIHLAQKKFVVYSDSVYAAIQNTNILYNELDMLDLFYFRDTALQNFFSEKGKYFLEIQGSDKWKRLIDRINQKYDARLSYDKLEDFVSFGQKLQNSLYQPEKGVQAPDLMLAQHAASLGKETAGLETYLLQFSMIYEILDARLEDTTMDMGDEAASVDQMKRFYVVEQLDSITKIVENINPGYREIVFDKRNRTMADSIEKHSIAGPCFFAIGCGHLGGSAGVIELLRKKGFILTPVHSENKISMLVINNMIKMSKKNKAKSKDDEDVKIDVIDAPKQDPPKVKVKPAPVKPKTKNQK